MAQYIIEIATDIKNDGWEETISFKRVWSDNRNDAEKIAKEALTEAKRKTQTKAEVRIYELTTTLM